jgi:hypothetical protein
VKTYRRFLLGIASKEEESRAEEAILAGKVDASFLHELEDEIIDDYLLGNIAREEEPGFTEHFLAVKERKERVAFATALVEYAQKHPAERPSVKRTFAPFQNFLRFSSWRGAALLATAACVLFAALAGNEHIKLRRQVQLTSETRHELTGVLGTPADKSGEHSETNLLSSKAPLPPIAVPNRMSLAQSDMAIRNSEYSQLSIPDVAFISMPTIEFGAATRSVYPTLLRIPAKAQFVRIELKLPSPLAEKYREIIVDPSGQRLWALEFPASIVPAGQRSTIVLPSSILEPGLYHFQVERAPAEGQFGPLEDHVFRVVRE